MLFDNMLHSNAVSPTPKIMKVVFKMIDFA